MTMTDVETLVTPPDGAEVVPTRVEFWLERRTVNTADGSCGPWRSVPPAQPHVLPPFYTMAKGIMEDTSWKGSRFQYRIVKYAISGVVFRDSGMPALEPEPEVVNLPEPA